MGTPNAHAPGCHCYCCNSPDGSLYQDQLTGEWWQKRDGVWLLGRLVFEPDRVGVGGMPEGQVGEPGSPTSPPTPTQERSGMKIAVDVDGCVADFMGGVCYQHNAEFATHLTEADITEWDFMPLTVFEQFGHTKWPRFWRWVQYHDLFAGLAMYPGAKAALQGLLTRGAHTVHFVTHRPDWAETTTLRWLRDQGFVLPLVLTQAKWEWNYDIFLDDSPEVLTRLADAGKRAVRMVRPWNREVPGIPEADTWRMAVALIEGMLA